MRDAESGSWWHWHLDGGRLKTSIQVGSDRRGRETSIYMLVEKPEGKIREEAVCWESLQQEC